MPVILIGDEREAHNWSAEEYKSAVRAYMESIGYAQTVDSHIEGTVEDMVFLPAVPVGLSEAHVEVKDTDLSLTDPDLRREVGNHLRRWMAEPQSRRFDFYIFARGLRSPAKWRALFREPTVEGIGDFLSLGEAGADSKLRELVDARQSDALTFFSRTFVVRGTGEKLQAAAAAKEVASLGSRTKWAEELNTRMARRLAVGQVPDTLVSNLVQVRFHWPFALVDVTADYLEDLVDSLGIEGTPPCRMVSKRKLLTFSMPRVTEMLAAVRTGGFQTTSLANVELEYPGAVESLIHQFVGKIAIAKGAVFDDDLFYFPARREGRVLRKFEVSGLAGKQVSLADPKYMKSGPSRREQDFAGRAGLARLNFVVHSGFRVRVESLWGDYFLAFIPHRVYTGDGLIRLDAHSVTKLDRKFRNPRFNRASNQLTKLQAVVDYLFSQPTHWVQSAPSCYGALKVDYPEGGQHPDQVAKALLRIQTPWKPVPEAKGEPTLEELVGEDEDET